MTVFFFIKYFVHNYEQYLQKIYTSNAIYILDLEDSILDYSDKKKTKNLKKKYREILCALFDRKIISSSKGKFGLRINSPQTAEYFLDMELLKNLKYYNWETIILPKIENSNQVVSVIEDLKTNEISYNNLTIIIESLKGLKSIPQILEVNLPFVKYLIFGHADFNLDARIFPFIHQHHLEYWQWIHQIKNCLRDKGLTFINSPYLFLDEFENFRDVLTTANSIFNGKFGQVTLNLRQTIFCNEVTLAKRTPIFTSILSQNEVHSYAKNIVDFSKKLDYEKSFAIDHENRFICPQEMKMAELYLEQINEERI